MPGPAPTTYHRLVRDTLAADEPGLFRWYSSDSFEKERVERMRLELLRSSYRLSAESHERAHRLAALAAERVEVGVPISLYQLTGVGQNAALFFEKDAAHIGLAGPLLSSLDDEELLALFGHELSHHRLWTLEEGTFRVATELLEATVARDGAPPSFLESAVRNRRWTEVFADRGASIACGALEPAVRLLVKVETGATAVSAKDYLAQAHEVVDGLAVMRAKDSKDRTEEKDGKNGARVVEVLSTHPEQAVRVVALERWTATPDEADDEIEPWIASAPALETLDIVGQHALVDATRAILDRVLEPAFMRTDANVAHARRYFPEWEPGRASAEALDGDRAPAIDEYLAYVLLDFAVSDPALADVPLAHVLRLATELELREALGTIARKELKTTVAALDALEARAAALIEAATKAHAEAEPT